MFSLPFQLPCYCTSAIFVKHCLKISILVMNIVERYKISVLLLSVYTYAPKCRERNLSFLRYFYFVYQFSPKHKSLFIEGCVHVERMSNDMDFFLTSTLNLTVTS